MSGVPTKVYARVRPTQPPLEPVDAMLTVHRLHGDVRYRRLSTAAKTALTTFVESHMGADGWGYPKREVWAKEAGISVRTLDRAIRQLEITGLLSSQPYLRPPVAGSTDARMGASTRRLDPRLLPPRRAVAP